MKKILFAALALPAAVIAGCSGSNRAAGTDADTAAVADSAVRTELPAPIEALPDTAYASAEAVKAVIDVFDETIDPQIDNLADLYANTPGSFTFRKNTLRNADYHAALDTMPTAVEVVWRYRTSASRSWGGGSGWTGQPVYVEWPDSCLRRFKALKEGFSGREIIVGGLSGHVYFIDFESGESSREPLSVSNPIKGSVSLDPTLNGNLYVGQGIPDVRPFGALVVDLYAHRVSDTFAEDRNAYRAWGAYDSSAARVGQFLFRPGENGTLYKLLVEPGRVRLQSTLRYKVNGASPGLEASIAVWANYGYIADNGGNVICVNLNTMKPVWHYSTGDDTDHTPVIIPDADGHPYVYTGCEVDKQGEGRARLSKLDALTGREVWHNDTPARLKQVEKKHFDGGFYGTSLPGRGDCSDLLFANCVLNTDGQNGMMMAIDRASGRTVYTVPLRYYAWSSPVGMLTADGRQVVVNADCAGNIYLIEGRTGRVISRTPVGANFESSAVAVGNCLVVGSRGDTIYKMRVI